MSRRRVLGCCAAAAAGLFTGLAPQPSSAGLIDGWWNACRPADALEPALADLVAQTFEGLDASKLWDVHAHLLGTGDSGSGCTVHPSLVEGIDVRERMRLRGILNATCTSPDEASIDRAYVARLKALAQGFPTGARWMLFAFDHAHDERGRADPNHSTFHVPNAYAARIAREHAARFEWVASVHPYREDAVQRLDDCLKQGAVAVKWLPGAMNIDLRDARCKPFYARLVRARVPLIVHCGEERAVPGAGRHDLGNPLLVRAPLAAGVRVIVAHCASLGTALDLDQQRPAEVSAFDLFARLMQERDHQDRLLGDISAAFQSNREPRVWTALIDNEAWHARLLHGSDHPLPGVPALHRPKRWVQAGLVDEAMATRIDALRHHNPLLAALAIERAARQGSRRFGAAVFATAPHFERAA